MPRPRKTLRPISKNIHLPEDIVLQTELHLYSELEGKVPYGAWQGLVEKLLREHFERVKQQQGFKEAVAAVLTRNERNGGDCEGAHMATDGLMEEQLTALGFGEGIALIRNSPRWYA